MRWTLTETAQTFDSISLLIAHLKQMEQHAAPDEVKRSLRLTVDALDQEDGTALYQFLISKERMLAFEVDIQTPGVSDAYRNQLRDVYWVQSRRLHALRLLPRALELCSASVQLRHAKVSLVRGRMQQPRHIAMQQQQQQQQQMAVQAKHYQPATRASYSNLPTYEAVADLSRLITGDNINEQLGEFWRTLSYSRELTLREVWCRLVGMRDDDTLKRLTLTAPMLQCVQYDAMKQILAHLPAFIDGVVAHNLPEGFFWMRHVEAEQSSWVLCFDAVQGKAWRNEPVNPLTIDYQTRPVSPPIDVTPAYILKLLAFRLEEIQQDMTEAVVDNYGPLYAAEGDKQEKLEILSDFIFLFNTVEKDRPELFEYCNRQLGLLSEHLENSDIIGLGHTLFLQGIPGVVVLLGHLEKLVSMEEKDAFLQFRSVYLREPADYTRLLQPAELVAFDGLCRLSHDALKWWWQAVAAQPEVTLFTRLDLGTEVSAYLYFLKTAATIVGGSTLPWQRMTGSRMRHPLKMMWDRALWILQRAAFPKEQFELLHTVSFDPWREYFASYQNQFHLVNGEMQLVVGMSFNADYRVRRLSADCTGHFDVHVARYLGTCSSRLGSWDDYAHLKTEVLALAMRGSLHYRIFLSLLVMTTAGENKKKLTSPFAQETKQALRALAHMETSQWSLVVMEMFAVLLPQFEETAAAGQLTLTDLTQGMRALLACRIVDPAQLKEMLAIFAAHGGKAVLWFNRVSSGKYADIAAALKAVETNGLVNELGESGSEKEIAIASAVEAFTRQLVTMQQRHRADRLILPTLTDEWIRYLRAAIADAKKVPKKENAVEKASRLFQGILLGIFEADCEFFFERMTRLAHLFSEHPYQLEVLKPVLLEMGAKIKELRTGFCWKPVKLAKMAFWASIDKEDIKTTFASWFPTAQAQQLDVEEVISFLKGTLDFVLAWLKEDCLTWLEPLIESVFALIKGFESSDLVINQSMLEELLRHVAVIERALSAALKHPIHKQSMLDWLVSLQRLLKGSYFEHTVALVILVIKEDRLPELMELAKPFIQSYWETLMLATRNPSLEYYESFGRCEQEGLVLYQALVQPPYHILRVVNELADYRAALRYAEIHQGKDTSPDVKELQCADYKIRQNFHLRWLRQRTPYCTAMFSQSIRHKLLLALEHAEPSIYSIKLHDGGYHGYRLARSYLTAINMEQPLYQWLFETRMRYLQLHHLVNILNKFDKCLHSKEYFLLIQALLKHYEKNTPLNAMISILTLLETNAYVRPVVLFDVLCDALSSGRISFVCPASSYPTSRHPADKPQDASNGLSRALDQVKQAFTRDDAPLSEDARCQFYLQIFVDAFTVHPLLPEDKLRRWRAVGHVNQSQLGLLLQRLVDYASHHTSSDEGLAMIGAVIRCLDEYIETTPQVLRCLSQVMQTPSLQRYWLRFPTDQVQGRALIGFVDALSEYELSSDEWRMVEVVLATQPWERLQALFKPLAYRPYPAKARYLALLSDADPKGQDEQLHAMLSDPVGASRLGLGPTSDLVLAQGPQYDETQLNIALDTLSTVLPYHDAAYFAMLKVTLKRELLALHGLIQSLLPLYLPELSLRQLEAQRVIRTESDNEVSQTRLEWLATISVIMKKTTGVTEGILPNATQLMAVLLSWHTDAPILLQLNTGEGKSFVAALLAAWKWVRVGTVDVLSSNQGLVHQDYVEKGIQYFFAALQIPSCILRAGNKQVYQAGYVYYTTPWDRSFIASEYFVSTHRKLNIRVAGVADECDLLLLKLLLTFDYVRSLHGENHLEWIYPLVLDFIALPAFREIAKDAKQVWGKTRDIVELRRYIASQPLSAEQQAQWEKISSNDWQLNRWLTAACEANKRLHFLISADEQRKGYDMAVPVVSDVPQIGASYSRAVHCFLHVLLQRKFRDRCFDIPEEVSAIDTDYPLGLAAMYSEFVGLSATLGTRNDQLFLRSKLGVVSYVVPSHIPSKLHVSARRLCATADAHVQTIVDIIRLSGERASFLIIEDEAEHVEAMHRRLQAILRDGGYTLQVVIGHEDAQTLRDILLKAEQPGVITLCTTLFSRGKDLHPAHQLVAVMACLKESATEQQGWGRAGRFGQPGEAYTCIDASRYGVPVEVLTASVDAQSAFIEQCQVRLSQEEAVERYYSQEAAMLRAGALAWFDKGVSFLLEVALPERREELDRQLLMCRQQWIERMVELWEEALLETDPDCVYDNLYIRRGASGELDVGFIEALLQAYPGLIHHAWGKLKQDMLEVATPCLRDVHDDLHASHQAKWLFEIQDITTQLRRHQQAQTTALRGASASGEVVNHTGFGCQDVRLVQHQPDDAYRRKLQFLSTWHDSVQDRRRRLLALSQAVKEIEERPFPWGILTVDLPTELQGAMSAILRGEQDPAEWRHRDVDEPLRMLQALPSMTIEQSVEYYPDSAIARFGYLVMPVNERIALFRRGVAQTSQALVEKKDLLKQFEEKKTTAQGDIKKALKAEIATLTESIAALQQRFDSEVRQLAEHGTHRAELVAEFERAKLELIDESRKGLASALIAARSAAIDACRAQAHVVQQRLREQLRQYEGQCTEVAEIHETERRQQVVSVAGPVMIR